MIPTYCCHHLPATDRKEYLCDHFDTRQWHWVTDYLPTDKVIAEHPVVHCEHAAHGQGVVSAAELSLYYKHLRAIGLIALRQEFALIVEDDIEPPNFDFARAVDDFVEMMKDHSADLVFVGSLTGFDVTADRPALFHGERTLTRCTHAYIVNPACAARLSKHLQSPRAPIDWHLNYAIQELGLKSCWSWPHVNQRTEKNRLPSLLRNPA
jgi:GR25 family glycosyltransferase involved in LPS biosynthesis